VYPSEIPPYYQTHVREGAADKIQDTHTTFPVKPHRELNRMTRMGAWTAAMRPSGRTQAGKRHGSSDEDARKSVDQSFELGIETNSADTHTTFPVKSVQGQGRTTLTTDSEIRSREGTSRIQRPDPADPSTHDGEHTTFPVKPERRGTLGRTYQDASYCLT
jgi:hypothetical protein